MPCFSRRCAIPSRAWPSAAKCCAENSTPWPATPREPCSPGTAEPILPTQRKSWPAKRIICEVVKMFPMPTRIRLRLAGLLIVAAIAIALLVAWRANVRDRAQLAADLATAKQTLAQANARQHDREAQLARSLAAFAAEKRSVTTPTQIVRDLPRQIPLPAPITLQSGSSEISSSRSRPAAAASNT